MLGSWLVEQYQQKSNQWWVEKYFSCLSFGVLDFYFIILFHLTVQFAKSTVKSCSISSFIHSGNLSFLVWQILFVHHPNLKGSLKSNSPTSITQYSLFFFLVRRIFLSVHHPIFPQIFFVQFFTFFICRPHQYRNISQVSFERHRALICSL